MSIEQVFHGEIERVFHVEIETPVRETRCLCSGCGWIDRHDALHFVEVCRLAPNQPSPAGRCPKCNALAYVEVVPDWKAAGIGYWGEDPRFPVGDWKYEVANDRTRDGYWEWVKLRIQEVTETLPPEKLRRLLAEDDANSLMTHARAGDREKVTAFALAPPTYEYMGYDALAAMARNRGLLGDD
jgi:hypothetical protein